MNNENHNLIFTTVTEKPKKRASEGGRSKVIALLSRVYLLGIVAAITG